MVTRKPLNDLLGQNVDYPGVPKPEAISWNVGILKWWVIKKDVVNCILYKFEIFSEPATHYSHDIK